LKCQNSAAEALYGIDNPAPGQTAPIAAPGRGSATQALEAAQRGDLPTLRSLLEGDASLWTVRDESDLSLVCLGAINGHRGIVDIVHNARGYTADVFDAAAAGPTVALTKLLDSDGYLVDARTRSGVTPLLLAALAGNGQSVETLVFRGASLDAVAPMFKGISALHAAADCRDRVEAEWMCQVLAGNAADPNLQQADGSSPLHAASRNGHANVVRLFQRKGARPDTADLEGRLPIDLARRAKHLDVVALLQDSPPTDVYSGRYKYNRQWKELSSPNQRGLPQSWVNQYVVLAHSNAARVTEMTKQCSDLIHARATFDELAVEAAAHVGFATLVEFLLGQGAPLSICTAAVAGLDGEVKAHLREDPSRIRERGPHDFPLFFYPAFPRADAVRPVHVEIAEILVAAGANPAVSLRGLTALHLSARGGNLEFVDWLLKKGVNPTVESSNPAALGTPLQLAVRANQPKVVARLKEAGVLQ